MDWGLPESQQSQVEGDRELFVGGVHVHIFLKDPHFPLRNPKVTPTHHAAVNTSCGACMPSRKAQ